MKKRHQFHKYLFLLTICILVFSLLLPGCGSKEKVTTEEEETVGEQEEEEIKWYGANVRLANFVSGSNAYCPGAFDELEKLGGNVIRLTGASKIGQYDMGIPFESKMLEVFLTEADKRGFKTIFVLGSLYPYFGAVKKTPFNDKLAESLKIAAEDIIKRFANDDRILMWDLMNEPNVADADLMAFLNGLASSVKAIDHKHPITIGGWSNDSSGERIPDEPADGAKTVDLVDYYSPHKYFGKRQLPVDPKIFFQWTDQQLYDWVYDYYKEQIEEIKKYAQGKPIILQEFAGAGPFENVVAEVGYERAEEIEAATFDAALKAIEDNDISGALFWEFIPYSPSFNVRSTITYNPETSEYNWRQAGHVIQTHYKFWTTDHYQR